ncbi:MAG TPA: isoprenylcysteine carboxylmethyltransferase family protein [Bacteroidia bacterium]|jgi:protein-S-isoprenylcysteine O-methyltransferase Ste14|nr:isoprenylcysteine carboxylmethyltransferase family protein [Bacteroidia bacterium]
MIELIIAYVFLATFFLLDTFLRKGKTAKSLDKTASDNRSTLFLVITFFTVLFISVILNCLKIGTFHNELISIIGLLIMAIGLFIRISSILTLGKYYTRKLLTTDTQEIVQNGIYKYLRHPGYLGTILIWSAAGIAMQNLAVFIMATVLILASYYYRITNEEKMLLETFGEKYTDYKKHSWRIVPFIW